MSKPKSDKSRVRRVPKRGHYDSKTIYGILDQSSVCHVSFIFNGYPVIIPTIYGRKNNTLYLHGATSSRMLTSLLAQDQICIAVTFVDGIILARSLFHSSMNYRSVVLFGKPRSVAEDQKMEALKIISDQIVPGRWEDARLPNDKELKATALVAFDIEEGSAKIRTGPPGDEKEDYDLHYWAGEIPLRTIHDPVNPDPLLGEGISAPEYIHRFIRQKNNPN